MPNPSNYVTIGKIVNAFGVQGWVKIKTDNQDCSSLTKYAKLYLFINDIWCEYIVEKATAKGNLLQAKLKGINTCNQALALKGIMVGILRKQFPRLASNEYYWVDLIGLKVYNTKQQLFGIVDSLMETGANSVLVVKQEAKQHLIPFVAAYILKVDLNNRHIIVEWELDY